MYEYFFFCVCFCRNFSAHIPILFWELLLIAYHTPVFVSEVEFAAFDGKAQAGVVLHEMGAALFGKQGESGVAGLAAALYCIHYQTLAYAALAELRQHCKRVEVPFAGEGFDVGGVKFGPGYTGEQRKGYASGCRVAFAAVADHRSCPFAVHEGNPGVTPGVEGVAAAAYVRQGRLAAPASPIRNAGAGTWGVYGHICQMRGGENDLPEELCVLFARITDGNIVDCFTQIITNIANLSLLSEYTGKSRQLPACGWAVLQVIQESVTFVTRNNV